MHTTFRNRVSLHARNNLLSRNSVPLASLLTIASSCQLCPFISKICMRLVSSALASEQGDEGEKIVKRKRGRPRRSTLSSTETSSLEKALKSLLRLSISKQLYCHFNFLFITIFVRRTVYRHGSTEVSQERSGKASRINVAILCAFPDLPSLSYTHFSQEHICALATDIWLFFVLFL